MRDIRLAIRSLARSPRFTLAALLALGLGIGAATTVFSVADGLLFKPLPYRDSDRLVAVMAAIRSRGMVNWDVPAADLEAWRTASSALADLAGHRTRGRLTLMLPGQPEDVAAAGVTPNFLRVLGVTTAAGREFAADEFVPGPPRALILTDATWRRLFNADRGVVGRSLVVNGVSAQVVGVLPRTFAFPTGSFTRATDVLVPFAVDSTAPSVQERLTLIGRLASGASIERVRVDLDGFAKINGGESGLRNGRIDGATVEPILATLVTASRINLMWLLVGAVTALLLIGCANVANLLVARGADRRGELALRAALGASRGSLVTLQLVETAVLATLGGALGVLLSVWAVGIVNPLVPDDFKLLKDITVDARALGAALVASLTALVVCGVIPAFRLARTTVGQSLQQATSRSVSGRLRGRQLVVASEVALAVILLTGGALMTNAMMRLVRVDHGYANGDRVLTMFVQMPRGSAPLKRSPVFVERVLNAVRSVPGVRSAGAMNGTPLTRSLYAGSYVVEGFSAELMDRDPGGSGSCCTQSPDVSVGYFEAMGVPVVRGRAFTQNDLTSGLKVAIINERLARKFSTAVDPIGHFLINSDTPGDRRLIIGVVKDIRDLRLEDRPMQAIYTPLEEEGATGMTLAIRTDGNPTALAPAVRAALQQSAGPVVISNVRTLNEMLLRSASERRVNAWLFGSFGVLGLLLAATGIYGVISYAVARRTREMGVRLALGASPARVRRLVIGQTLVPVTVGLAVGLGASLALSRYLASLLYEVTARDAMTYLIVCAILLASALTAAYLPARRASRVDPVAALRAE
jgi:predicted permease